jgi:hypothetical protein
MASGNGAKDRTRCGDASRKIVPDNAVRVTEKGKTLAPPTALSSSGGKGAGSVPQLLGGLDLVFGFPPPPSFWAPPFAWVSQSKSP